MAPTTLTTMVLVLMGLGLLAMASVAWFGSWQPEPRRVEVEDRLSSDYRTAVREMRQAIADYERGRRPL